jgi:hypothetical protein
MDLPEHLLKVAREQINEPEDPAARAQAVVDLRARLEALPEGERPHRLDDDFLIAYIRGCKYRLELAERKILALEAFRRENPQWVQVRAEVHDCAKRSCRWRWASPRARPLHRDLPGCGRRAHPMLRGPPPGDATILSQDLRAEEFVDFYGQGFMRILKGHAKDGCMISTLLPAKMTDIQDPNIFMRWNFWVLSELLTDPNLQVRRQVAWPGPLLPGSAAASAAPAATAAARRVAAAGRAAAAPAATPAAHPLPPPRRRSAARS